MSRNSLKSVCRLINSVQQEIPIEKQFLGDLKRSIELTDKANSRKPSQTYKPSSMNCIRNMYYQRTGAEVIDEPNAVLIGICETGTDRHKRVQDAISHMKDNGIDCEYIDVEKYIKSRNIAYIKVVSKEDYETKLWCEKLQMSFMCDGIIRYKSKYYIIEIKTESAYKWTDRKGVAEVHKNQATAYSMSIGIDDVIFIYISRDTCDMKTFIYTPTPEEKDELQSKIMMCEKYVHRQELPPKPIDITSKTCQYCGYKELCNAERVE